mgnify:CR=1 FL=1
MNKYDVRKIIDSDIEEIAKFFHKTVHTVASKYYNKSQCDVWASKDKINIDFWKKRFKDEYVFVALFENKIVGFISLRDDGLLDHLYIDKKHQGTPVRNLLWRNILIKVEELGLKRIFTEASIMAMPIAKRMGFRLIKKQTIKIEDLELTNYLMEKMM